MASKRESSSRPLVRVLTDFDSSKTWYLLEKQTLNVELRKLKDQALSKAFPDEFRFEVDSRHLRTKDGLPFPSSPRSPKVAIGTAFAFISTLLRQRDLSLDKLNVQIFQRAIDALNELEIDSGLAGEKKAPMSSQQDISNDQLQTLKEEKLLLEKQLASCNKTICDLKEKIMNIIGARAKNTSFDSSSLDSSDSDNFKPSVTSTPITRKRKHSDSSSSKSNSSISNLEESQLLPATKRRKIRKRAKEILNIVKSTCEQHNEDLASALAYCCISDAKKDSEARDTIQGVINKVCKEKGPKQAFEMLVSEETWESRLQSMRVPDWQLLLFKIQGRVSDQGWQTLTNLTKLGRTGKKTDISIVLTKNHIKTLRHMIFKNVKALFNIQKIPADVVGYQVDLSAVVVWCAREMQLHGHGKKPKDKIVFNLKLDGRPFFGREQVLVGIVPVESPVVSNQSCKAVYPLAISNCKENRNDLKKLIKDINRQKRELKCNGISVDGREYDVSFVVTLDLKALYILLVKEDDEDFVLGGKGIEQECCFLCGALRGCNCKLKKSKVCEDHFSSTKANIGGFKGIRDDLTFLFEEDISSITICALHCEMRNTEQLLSSVGLLSYRIRALDDFNKELKIYDPESFKRDRVTVKLKHGQETAVEKHNMSVASFSGNTERKVLKNFDEIVKAALPIEKLTKYFKDPQFARQTILNKARFCQERIQYFQNLKEEGEFIRDFGTHQDVVSITGSAVGERIEESINEWQSELKEIETNYIKLNSQPAPLAKSQQSAKKSKRRKQQAKEADLCNSDHNKLSEFASQLVVNYHVRVCKEWREIAETMQKQVYTTEQEHLIDIFDLKCKEWGFLLRELFGPNLGCGDYGHIVVEHIPMLMRVFRSLKNYVNQGLEAAHSYQKLIYSRATSHDCFGYGTSLEQILVNFYTERMLHYRLCFREALKCSKSGKVFHFRGCGWQRAKANRLSLSDRKWIVAIDALFTDLFGADVLKYGYNGTKCYIKDPTTYCYNHTDWEDNYLTVMDALPAQKKSKSMKGKQSLSKTPKTQQQTLSSPTPVSASDSSEKITQNTTCVYPDLKHCMGTSKSSRLELSALVLPPVSQGFKIDEIEIVYDPPDVCDPFEVPFRPSEAVVSAANTLITRAKDDNDESKLVAAKFSDIGIYSESTLTMWSKASRISEVKYQVLNEEKWLKNAVDVAPSHQIDAVQSNLFHSLPDKVLLKSTGMSIDVIDFSSLACERYLTGFCINVTCFKFIEEARKKGVNSTIFLPTTMQTLCSSPSADQASIHSKFKRYTTDTVPQELRRVVIPIHMQLCHWGLLCLDITKQQLLFDDGLHWIPPKNIVAISKKVLDSLKLSFPQERCLDSAEWDFSIKRFSMPTQPKVGEGSSSCGVGVILAAKDMILSNHADVPKFKWEFKEMRKHRIDLMNQIVIWMNHST